MATTPIVSRSGWGAGAAAAAFLLLETLAAGARAAEPAPSPQRIKDEFGFRVVASSGTEAEYRVSWEAATPEQTEEYLPKLESALSRFPKGFLNRVRLDSFVLARRIVSKGVEQRALTESYPDWSVRVLMDVPYALGPKRNPAYLQKAIFHELFHVFDTDSGTLAEDPEWERLTSGGYPLAGQQYSSRVNGWIHPSACFISEYAKTGSAEDKADLFAYLIVDPEAVKKAAATDPCLATKLRLLKARYTQELPEFFKGVD